MVEDGTLTLNANILGPLDKTTQVAPLWSDVATDAKITGTRRVEGVNSLDDLWSLVLLLGCFLSLGCLFWGNRYIEQRTKLMRKSIESNNEIRLQEAIPYIPFCLIVCSAYREIMRSRNNSNYDCSSGCLDERVESVLMIMLPCVIIVRRFA